MSAFNFGAPKEEEKKVLVGGGGEEGDGDEGGDDGPIVEEECAATFTPVVKLEAVDTKTMEEDEDVVYKERARLFTFSEAMLDKGTGNKQWNERGIGEVKVLKHKEHSKIRLLMRQEKTMKIIVNHLLDPRWKIEQSVGNDKSLCWTALDFSDLKQLVDTTFAIRFKTAEIAQEFKTAFVKAQADNAALAAGADSKEGAAEADAAAAALAAVSLSSDSPAKQAAASSPEKAAEAAAP